jgi:RNA-directed DNA polymerase
MATVKSDFDSAFSYENLEKIFNTDLADVKSTGVDSISALVFNKDLKTQIELIQKKVFNQTYRFTRYKQKLISKGAGKAPREVYIPTIRDRLALKALNQFLQKRLLGKIDQPLPQHVTKQIKSVLIQGDFDSVIKLDIVNFYPTIKHLELIKRIRKFITSLEALHLILGAISTGFGRDSTNNKGIPQGLPISNILASLYLRNIDIKNKKNNKAFYCRYVDDLLIFCNGFESRKIINSIVSDCKRIGLDIYDPKVRPDKSYIGDAKSEFSYLGYRYNPKTNKKVLASVRPASKSRLIDSLSGIFTSYYRSKDRSLALLQWRINIRITGCISENKCKGWLFFFSEIDDKQLLNQLDHVINQLSNRFVSEPYHRKSFSRAWHEIKYKRWSSNYFPNFDKYDIQHMKEIVATYEKEDIAQLNFSDATIRDKFWRIIKKELKEMETDVMDFSY